MNQLLRIIRKYEAKSLHGKARCHKVLRAITKRPAEIMKLLDSAEM